jgi:hypothetical protein
MHLLEHPGPIMINAQKRSLSLLYIHTMYEVLPLNIFGNEKQFQEHLNYCQKGFMSSTW